MLSSASDDEVGALQGAIRAERALASEAIRHGQTRELGNAHSATDPQRRVMSGADACRPGGQLRRSRVRVLAVE
jgi:hypothetical protein